MSNGLPVSFWKVSVPFMSVLTERISLLKSIIEKKLPVRILEGWKGKLMISWLMVKGS